MEGYTSEREQLDQLRKWWDSNGKAIAIGLTLGLAGLFGYRYWQTAQNAQAESASINYQHLLVIASKGPSDEARETGQALIDSYGKSVYAPLAALLLAKLEVEAGDLPAARTRLQWVVDNAGKGNLGEIARVRLAQIELDAGNADGAWKLLEQLPASAGKRHPELRGDVQAARGEREDAAALYAQALAGMQSAGIDPALLELKQDSLGAGAPAAAGK